ncbi:TspO protein [candidate division TA06 bacterium DG_24]|uniref:TspO protein n=2 Tax=Bacteria division TA06 TaxID=1156500 RepID=A0A0S8GBC7_UNCT6|nr:MAG: TspO protein [candidate division TA06 bacterium DG_24]KPK69842.1 MAG: TspO protein [candidate division TA06 bacterium SM23_40]
MKPLDLARLVISIVLCQSAGVIGSIFTARSVSTWYPTLRRPFFNPPSWVFGPVWITLYLLMGISLFLVWRKGVGTAQVRVAIVAFAVQLILNAAWSGAFFGLRSPLAGLIVILLLWVAISVTIVLFRQISALASLILIPYIAWVSFAAILNASIYALNR